MRNSQSSKPSTAPPRNRVATAVFALSLLLAGILARPWEWWAETPIAVVSPAAASQPALTPAQNQVAAQGHSVSQTEAIENIRVGRRTAGKNPQGAENTPEPTAENSRLISLRLVKPNGCLLEMEFLWTLDDIQQLGAQPGALVHIEIEEMGVSGLATVAAVSDQVDIRPGKGNLVTGTFRHEIAPDEPLYNVWLEGAADPIGCTGNHPFWSEDREDFVRADELQSNEMVYSVARGAIPVARIDARPWSPYVYNLQVHGQQVYEVGPDGVLVHNSYGEKHRFVDGPSVRLGGGATAERISGSQAKAIQDFANKYKVKVTVVGSRVNPAKSVTAGASDWDYLINPVPGFNPAKKLRDIRKSGGKHLPRGAARSDDYGNSRSGLDIQINVPVDHSLPHIHFTPGG